jgi:hypothetical protein
LIRGRKSPIPADFLLTREQLTNSIPAVCSWL